ncbi:hypothetical protein VP01_5382g1, partial [Puccinia sorghi]
INVQHNCIDGGCKTVQANVPRHNCQEDSSTSYFVVHSINNSYIINVFSHQSAMYHRAHSNITIPPISDSMFEESIHQGKQVWHKEDIYTGKKNIPSSMSPQHQPPQLPEFIQRYIHGFINVKAEGHCGLLSALEEGKRPIWRFKSSYMQRLIRTLSYILRSTLLAIWKTHQIHFIPPPLDLLVHITGWGCHQLLMPLSINLKDQSCISPNFILRQASHTSAPPTFKHLS